MRAYYLAIFSIACVIGGCGRPPGEADNGALASTTDSTQSTVADNAAEAANAAAASAAAAAAAAAAADAAEPVADPGTPHVWWIVDKGTNNCTNLVSPADTIKAIHNTLHQDSYTFESKDEHGNIRRVEIQSPGSRWTFYVNKDDCENEAGTESGTAPELQ
jgi:hypothetical protein